MMIFVFVHNQISLRGILLFGKRDEFHSKMSRIHFRNKKVLS